MSNQLAKRSAVSDVPFQIARLNIAFTRLSAITLEEQGLEPQGPGVGSVLHALFERDCQTGRDLVASTHIPKGTLSGILAKLEACGWVIREVDSQDRRAWRIKLTARGRALETKMQRRHQRFMQTLEQALGKNDIQKFSRLLAKATDAMRNAGAPPTPKGSSKRC